MLRRTAVTIDLGAIRRNVAIARAQAPRSAICAVVKADAYGHGAVPIARTLVDAGVDWLGVALIEEGVALREAGISTPILALYGGYNTDFATLVTYNLVPTIWRADQLARYHQAAQGRPAAFHLKVDTGMSRIGLREGELDAFLDALPKFPGLRLDGVLTHFANADLADPFNREQLARFDAVCAHLRARGCKPQWAHIPNSAAVLSMPESHGTLVRPGLMLYGLNPLNRPCPVALAPALSWEAEVVDVHDVAPGTRVSYGGLWTAARPSRIATIACGYADGYPRALSNRGHVIIRGFRAPIVGAICMDLMLADVTDIHSVSPADTATLIGQQGNESISADEVAEWANTISYEIICGVGKRVPRHYVSMPKA